MAKGDLKQHVSVKSRDELGELAAAFNQMSADLDRLNLSRRQMTADIAHDLRSPLTVIGGYVDRCARACSSPPPNVSTPSTPRCSIYNAWWKTCERFPRRTPGC